jgi:hypothetical protein
MSMESLVYLSSTDGDSRHTWNLASIAWVVYSPKGLPMSSGGVLLGCMYGGSPGFLVISMSVE